MGSLRLTDSHLAQVIVSGFVGATFAAPGTYQIMLSMDSEPELVEEFTVEARAAQGAPRTK